MFMHIQINFFEFNLLVNKVQYLISLSIFQHFLNLTQQISHIIIIIIKFPIVVNFRITYFFQN